MITVASMVATVRLRCCFVYLLVEARPGRPQLTGKKRKGEE